MLAYHVRADSPNLVLNIQYFWITGPVDAHRDTENFVLLRDDHRFCLYRSQVYRVCEIELDDDDLFIKVWVKDPFVGIEGYEQIDDAEFKPEYCI
jgi:hypothetical protein